MTRLALSFVLTLSAVASAHGGGHLKGVVTQLSDTQLTLATDEKEKVVSIALDKDSRFENDGKPSSSKALPVGSKVVVHLKPGAKPAVAALVKFVAATTRIDVAVTSDGFVVATPPALKAGQPVTLVVTRSVAKTCATDIVLKDFGISQPLPLNTPVEVTFTPKKAGTVRFACAMDMIAGSLKVD